jgi:hypothetical protein
MNKLEIQSLGPPPAQHADRVMAALMQQLAVKHALLWATFDAMLKTSSPRAGSPKAQHKLAARLRAAGAFAVRVNPGKRGKFTLSVFNLAGWDPARGAAITVTDPIPAKPWLVALRWQLQSHGGGRDTVNCYEMPILFITHHVCSRSAQRLGLRTGVHLLEIVEDILRAALERFKVVGSFDEWLATPPAGLRVPICNGSAMVVFKRHAKHEALVATTVLYNGEK